MNIMHDYTSSNVNAFHLLIILLYTARIFGE